MNGKENVLDLRILKKIYKKKNEESEKKKEIWVDFKRISNAGEWKI